MCTTWQRREMGSRLKFQWKGCGWKRKTNFMSQNRGQCMEHCHMLMFLRPVSGYSSNIWPTQYNPFTHRMINFSCRAVVLFHTIFGLRTKWRSKYLTPIQRHVYPWLRSYNPRVQAHRIFGPLLSSSTRIPTGCANHIKCLQIKKKNASWAASLHKLKSRRAQTFPKWSLSYNGIAVLRTSFWCQYFEMF